MADNQTIARPYAHALFELAHAAGELGPWSGSLEGARALLEDGRVVEYLGDPDFRDAQRLEFLTGLFAAAGVEKLAGGDDCGLNFLKLLLENGRIGVLPEIAWHFDVLKAETENLVEVTVTSASTIDQAQLDKIASAMQARLGRDVSLHTEIDESLIGGAVIRAGDVVIDGSMRARLTGLANALTK